MQRPIDRIAKLIPGLRRHAFMLTGSKELGDEHIRHCLESPAADLEQGVGRGLRAQLFRLFHQANPTINRIDDVWPDLTDSYSKRIWTTLQLLSTEECSALLLFNAEEFSLEETAFILDLKVERLQKVLTKARLRLAALAAKFVLIVEDDPLIGLTLNTLTAEMGFTSARVVRRMADAIEAAEKGCPGLVLADIELAGGGSGISAAQAILQTSQVPIVFITGYPDKLLTGQGAGPFYVVPKPFTQEHLTTVIDRALTTYASPANASSHRRQMLAHFQQIAAA